MLSLIQNNSICETFKKVSWKIIVVKGTQKSWLGRGFWANVRKMADELERNSNVKSERKKNAVIFLEQTKKGENKLEPP